MLAALRRLWSISLVIAMCWPLVLPAWATSCTHSSGRQVCHRAQHTHDVGMMNHDKQAGGSMSAAEQTEKCPMSCCTRIGSSAAQAVPLASSVNPVFLQLSFARFESQVFIAIGFSSHTDRGPPTTL